MIATNSVSQSATRSNLFKFPIFRQCMAASASCHLYDLAGTHEASPLQPLLNGKQ